MLHKLVLYLYPSGDVSAELWDSEGRCICFDDFGDAESLVINALVAEGTKTRDDTIEGVTIREYSL